MRRLTVAAAAVAALLSAPRLGAQGTLSGQGFGYPPGELSAPARGSAGAIAEFDAMSALNPAALVGWGPAGLHLQYEPEFRRVSASGAESRATQSRFPLLSAAIPLAQRLQLGISAATFLDRTWETQQTALRAVGTDTFTATSTFGSSGAINDVRLAAAYAPSQWFAVGLGIHALTGENRLSARTEFVTGAPLLGFADSQFVSYFGTALSAGAQARFGRWGGVAASYRYGGPIRARNRGDTLLATARVPDRLGLGLRIDRITGAVFGVRYETDQWSSLAKLGRAVIARDTRDLSAGAEISGPRVGSNTVMLRLGVRQRDLPFEAVTDVAQLTGAKVRERSASGGFGLPVGYGRAALDVAVTRAQRSTTVGVSESAWLLAFGITVRP